MKGRFIIWMIGLMILWVFAIVVLYLYQVLNEDLIAVFDWIDRWHW